MIDAFSPSGENQLVSRGGIHIPQRGSTGGTANRPSVLSGLRTLLNPHARGDEPVDALNVPWRFHYAILSVSAITLSFPSLVVSFTKDGAELAHPYIRASCVFGLAIAPFFVAMGRRWKWEFNYRFFVFAVLTGTVSLTASASVLQDLRVPLIASLLVSPMGAAFYFKPPHAVVHVLFTAVLAIGVGVSVGEDEALVQSVFLAIVIVCGGLMLTTLRRQLVHVVERNRALAELDSLTGAANVRCFERRYAEAIELQDGGGRPFALIGIDLDDFKQVNDRFSHTLGDDVLIASVEAIRSVMLPSDLLVRRGGDEFLVLAPASDRRDVDDLVGRISREVVRARYELCPDVIPTTTSAWVEREVFEDNAGLIQRMDAALNAIKENSPSTRRGTVTQDEVEEIIDEVIDGYGLKRSGQVVFDDNGSKEREPVKTVSENPIAGATHLAWRTAAFATWAFSGAALFFVIAGIERQSFGTMTIGVMLFSSLVLAPAFYWMSLRDLDSLAAIHVLAAGTLIVISVACIAVGDIGPYAAEMFLMPILIVPALLARRVALVYCALAAIGYAAIIVANGYHPAQLRINNSLLNTALLATVIGITRGHTVKAAAEAASLARIDALTGLPNLRRLRARLDDEIRRCTERGERVGLLMFDLDDFKAVNDLHSHSIGDRVLVEVADALDATARHSDMPARRGGDEFALVLTDCDAAGASAVAARVGTTVAQARLRVCPDVQPTASIGWAVWEPGETSDDLLARVDLSLHAQKVVSHEQRERLATAV